ncbi:hypothetical protein ABIC88_005865 [Pseudomonas kilonensis]
MGASLLAMGPGQAHRWWLVYRYREQARSHRYSSVFGPLVLGHASAWLTHRQPLLWRGSLLPLGCAAAPNHAARWIRLIEVNLGRAAAQPSGSKLPRHGFGVAATSADSISMLGLTDRTQIPVGASLLAMGPGQAHRWWLVYRYREQARSHRYFSVFGPLVLGHAPAWLTHRRPLLWRGSLLPLGCAAAPNHAARWVRLIEGDQVGAAAQPSGSKLPRHTSSFSTRDLCSDG